GIIQRVARPNTGGSQPIENAVFVAALIFSSATESGALEQTQPGSSAASTAKVLDMVAASGGQVFDINNPLIPGDTASYYSSTIRPVLSATYTGGDLAYLDALVNAGYRAVA